MIDPRPFVDNAREILADADIPQESRASLWDLFFHARDSRDLAEKTANFGAPLQVKRDLVIAKRFTDPDYRESQDMPEPVKNVVRAIAKLRTIDPNALALVEKHKDVAKTLIDIATKSLK